MRPSTCAVMDHGAVSSFIGARASSARLYRPILVRVCPWWTPGCKDLKRSRMWLYLAHGQRMRLAVFYIVFITINSATGMHVWVHTIGRRPKPDATPSIAQQHGLRRPQMTMNSRHHLHRKLRQ